MRKGCEGAARYVKGSFRAKRKALDPIVVSSLDKTTIDGIDAVGWVVERGMGHQRDLLRALTCQEFWMIFGFHTSMAPQKAPNYTTSIGV